MIETRSAKSIVREFVEVVRSGKHPERASDYMADKVLAHQVHSEKEATVVRSPQQYTDHINEFLDLFGTFELEIQDILAEQDRVFVRWKQIGSHIGSIDGETPTGKPLIELTSTVYRVAGGKIVEYWLQFDRKGMDSQLHAIST